MKPLQWIQAVGETLSELGDPKRWKATLRAANVAQPAPEVVSVQAGISGLQAWLRLRFTQAPFQNIEWREPDRAFLLDGYPPEDVRITVGTRLQWLKLTGVAEFEFELQGVKQELRLDVELARMSFPQWAWRWLNRALSR